MTRMKDPPGDGVEAAGGIVAIGVVSNTSLLIHNVSDSVMPAEHVELIGQIESDYSHDLSSSKRVRREQTAANICSMSTLEYDKRIADS